MHRSLSSQDVERLTVKSKVLSLKMRSDANFGDRVVLGLLNDAIKKRSLPHDHVPRIHDLLDKFGVG